MSLLIYTAHTGGTLQADRHSFTSVDELRKWIGETISMAPACQIIMTARGTNVKNQSLPNEKELYLFDRRLLDASSSPPTELIPRLQTPSPFPTNLESETELSSWRTLFRKRLAWSESVLSHAQNLAATISETDASTNVVQLSVQIAFSNLEVHSLGLQNSLVKLQEWAEGVLVQLDRVFQEWEPALKRLVRIPVHDEVKKYGQNGSGKERKVSTLMDFFEVKQVQTAAVAAKGSAQQFEKEVTDLGGTIEEICARTADLKSDIQKARKSRPRNVLEEMKNLLGEIDILVKKIRTDYEYVQSLQGPKSVSTASKRAYASTTDYLPGLVNIVNDMGRLLQMAVKQKNEISATSVRQLQVVAFVQSLSAPVNPQIQKMDSAYQEEDEHPRLLSLVVRFPKIYGALLVECVRRREWSEKFANDSKRIAEEFALLKEDEEKRRKKWQRNTGTYLPFDLEDNTSEIMRAELTTRGDFSGGLPRISRQDVESFLSVVQNIEGLDSVVKEVRQLYQDLDRPLGRRSKRLKGFKFGSIHEASLGASSIFGRSEEEEVKVLREDKQNLTERVKGYESRIRKLEDLLHRGRTSGGNMYQVAGSSTPQQPSTPQPSQTSFPTSIAGPLLSSDRPSSPAAIRRISVENADKPMVARISALEAELAAEKELTAQLQRDASSRIDLEKAMTTRMALADETKRDLVANLEDMGQQHIVERRVMEQEIEELRQKLDEAYEEMDRIEEGRNEEARRRSVAEERMKGLEGELAIMGEEVDRLRMLNEDEVKRVKELVDEVEFTRSASDHDLEGLRGELRAQKKLVEAEGEKTRDVEAALDKSQGKNRELVGAIETCEAQIKQMKDSLDTLNAQYTAQQQGRESIAAAIRQVHSQLSTDPPPDNLDTVQATVQALISKALERIKDLDAKVKEEEARASEVEARKALLQSRFDSRTIKAKDLTQRLYTHNARSIQLLESLGYRIVRGEDSMQIVKVPKSANTESTVLSRSAHNLEASVTGKPSPLSLAHSSTVEDINLLYWMETEDSDAETEKYTQYLKKIGAFDLDAFSDIVTSRVKKLEQDCRQLVKQCRSYREKYYRSRDEANEKIAYKSFKPGDLALFLPTRNSVTRPWAAFNVNAPHFFLKEDSSHKLANRDWLLARISKIEDRVVDLSRSTATLTLPPSASSPSSSSTDKPFSAAPLDDENPFELSDGLRWYLLDAIEEKPGAPTTPGLSTSTVAAANVDAKGSLRARKGVTGAKKTLTQITTEHNSRRSSSGSNSHRNSLVVGPEVAAGLRDAVVNGGVAASAVESVPGTPVTGVGEKGMEALRGIAAAAGAAGGNGGNDAPLGGTRG
ncbi:autophagy-related protein 11-domain-containing protein [Tuber indicum]|nr:autophagy-related protein 11-domain-containing protein [Tuber indicum]